MFDQDKEGRCNERILASTASFLDRATLRPAARHRADRGTCATRSSSPAASTRRLAQTINRSLPAPADAGRVETLTRWAPQAAVSARITPSTLVRLGAFRQLNTQLLRLEHLAAHGGGIRHRPQRVPDRDPRRSRTSPSSTAGRRASPPPAGSCATPRSRSCWRMALRSFRKPMPAGPAPASYANWISGRRLTFFADDQLIRLDADAFDRYDNLARIGVNVIIRAAGSAPHRQPRHAAVHEHADQRSAERATSSCSTRRELRVRRQARRREPARQQRFDRDFATVVEGLTIGAFLPDSPRRAVGEVAPSGSACPGCVRSSGGPNAARSDRPLRFRRRGRRCTWVSSSRWHAGASRRLDDLRRLRPADRRRRPARAGHRRRGHRRAVVRRDRSAVAVAARAPRRADRPLVKAAPARSRSTSSSTCRPPIMKTTRSSPRRSARAQRVVLATAQVSTTAAIR